MKDEWLTNRWTSRLRISLFRPNFFLIVDVGLVDAAALVNSMLGFFKIQKVALAKVVLMVETVRSLNAKEPAVGTL